VDRPGQRAKDRRRSGASAPPSAAGDLLTFRELVGRPSDRLLVERFVRTCGGEALGSRFVLPSSGDPLAPPEQWIQDLMAGRPDGVGLLALVGGTPVGVLNLVVTGPQEAELAVVVAQRWQRQGIGRRLVDEVRRRGRWSGWTVHVRLRWDDAAGRCFVASLPGPQRAVRIEHGRLEQEIHPFDPASPAGQLQRPAQRRAPMKSVS
jgi:GNAT superfamily N-acetyltransferase